MTVKIMGYDDVKFTDENTGEVVNGKRVYCEELDSPAEYGSMCSTYFFTKCISIMVGEIYELILKSQKIEGKQVFKPVGLKEI